MLAQLRMTWPYAVALAVGFLALPLIGAEVLKAQGADPVIGQSFLVACLIGYFPTMTFGAAMLAGYRHGIAWTMVPLAGLAFLPASRVVYNDTALVYAVVYAVVAVIGLVAGIGLRRGRAARDAAMRARG